MDNAFREPQTIVLLGGTSEIGQAIVGWQPAAGMPGTWKAPAANLHSRQLFVNGTRAVRATGPLPVTLTFGGVYTTPVLTVGTPRVNFKYAQGDSAPEAQTVQVTAKNATANFTVSTSSSWLTSTPTSGSTIRSRRSSRSRATAMWC